MLHTAFNLVGPDDRSKDHYRMPRTDLQIVPSTIVPDKGMPRNEHEEAFFRQEILRRIEQGETFDKPKDPIYH